MQIFFVENIKIMSKSEAYKKQEPIKQTVNEPVTEYRSPSTMGEMELLSDEIIIGAVKYAQIAREKGRESSFLSVSLVSSLVSSSVVVIESLIICPV